MKWSSVFAERVLRSKCDLQEGWYEMPLPPGDSGEQQTGETHVATNLLFIAAKKYMWKHVKNSKHFGWLPSNILSLFALLWNLFETEASYLKNGLKYKVIGRFLFFFPASIFLC